MRALPLFVLVSTVVGCSVNIRLDDPTDDKAVDTDRTDDTDDTDAVSDTDVDTPAVVTCATPLPPAADGLCDATVGAGDGLQVRGIVLTPAGIVDGGSVLLDDDGLITCVGCDCDAAPGAADATVVTCADGVISPGLINAHDHMTFSENAPAPQASRRYDHRHDWRGSIPTPDNPDGTGATSAGNRWVEVRQVLAGTTSMAGSGSAKGMVRNPDRDSNEGLDLPHVEYETFPLDDGDEHQAQNCDWDYKYTEREAAALSRYLPHVAEGINARAHEEFLCQSSSFDGAQDVTEKNAAHIHGVGLLAVDYQEMALGSTTLVWSPRSNVSLYGMTANVRLLDTLGGRVALGTDWTYSGSANMVRELHCADVYNRDHLDGWFSDADLWHMATDHAAHALGIDGKLGSLALGKIGDLAIFDGRDHPDHRAVLDAGASDVVLVLRAGVPLFGEPEVVDALTPDCDPLDVCGADRAICTQREFGLTWSQLQSATRSAYPAFFCDDAPTNEPTCVPSRPSEFTGTSTAQDPDGDGIASATDLCPAVFDPIRPLDGGAQPDADQDGVGDACDPTPLPADLDGDGLANTVDNCPRDDNATQLDEDLDGRGDVCDVCPDVPNTTVVCPTAQISIVDARTRTASGSGVSTYGVVTATDDYGFWIQDPSVATGVNAGLYVDDSGANIVVLGDSVDVEGVLDLYFDETRLLASSVRAGVRVTPLTPIRLTVSQAATEPYEGVLVHLTNGSVTDTTYDCSADVSACRDTGLWEIGGASGVVVFDGAYIGAAWASHVSDTPVTGVMAWRYDRRRILPRVDADFGP